MRHHTSLTKSFPYTSIPLAAAALLTGFLHAAPTPARKAEAFVHSIGVGVHMGYDNKGGAYTDFPMIKTRLQELGIHHYRDGFEKPKIKQHVKDFHNELGRAGIRGTFISGGGLTAAECIASAALVADSIEAFEGQNEILNIYTKWDDAKRDAARNYQMDLFKAVNAHPRWKNTPVLGPTCVGPAAYKALGDLSAHMDFGNFHPYPLGPAPAVEKSGYFPELKAANDVSTGKKLFATETGYTTGTSDDGNQRVSPAAAAKYAPRLFLENFNRGVLCTFWYELCDQGTDGSQESSFGLITKNHGYKPQGTAIKNLIGLLKEATFNPTSRVWESPKFTPGSLDYTLTGNMENIHSTLLQKSDGKFYLCLWQEVSSYNIDNSVEADIENPEIPVVIKFASPVSSAVAFRPTGGTTGTTLEIAANQINLGIPDEVVIIEITPTTKP